MVFDVSFFLNLIPMVAAAIPLTLAVTILPMVIGVIIAFFIALARMRRVPVLNQICLVFISFIRGVPLYVLLFVSYYCVPMIVQSIAGAFGYQMQTAVFPGFWIAIVCFTLHVSGYLAEVVRSALNAVNKQQMEAAQSLGMTTLQAYSRIIIPQAAIIALPNYANMFLTMLKSSSLVFTIAVTDIMAVAKTEAEIGFRFLESYLLVAIIYVVLCFLFAKIFKWIETYFKRRTSGFLEPASKEAKAVPAGT